MSRMIPRESIDVLRNFVTVSLDNYGIDCTLYIPSNDSTVEQYDAYAKPSDYTHTAYTTKVFIEWGPSAYRLKKLGLFTEEDVPMVCWFGNKATNESDELVDVDIIIGSYFRLTPEFIPDNYEGIEEFELINNVVKNMHDAVVVKGFSAAPRRVQI